jgi:hypothetical protein
MSLTVRDLIDLAAGDNEGANAQVTQVFQWRHERMMTLSRSSVGTGTALLIGLAIAVVTDDSSVNRVAAVVGTAGAVVVLAFGFVISWRTRRLDKQYVAAQFLLAELQTIRPFLRRYLFREGGR